MPKGVIFDEKQILASLFESAKSLKIIPEDFPRDFFEKHFFYFFIERNFFPMHQGERFAKNGFGQDYCKAMLNAFDFVFKNAQEKKLDATTIDEIYLLVTENSIPNRKRKYRFVLKIENALFEKNSVYSSGYYDFQASRKYLESVLKNPIAISYLIYRFEFGEHQSIIDEKENELENAKFSRLFLYDKSKFEIEKTVKIMLLQYHERMTIIDKSEKLKKDQKEEEKIKLIAIFINDIQRFHPYRDGNGRTFCFLILNYLLISQNLSPAFIFSPWHLSYSTADELPIVVKEGQLAYQKFFLGRHKITEKDREKPLSQDLASLFIAEENLADINQFIFLAIATGMQIQAIQGDERYSSLQAGLEERFNGAIKRLSEENYRDNLSKMEEFEFPINGKTFFDNIAIRGMQFLFAKERNYLLLRICSPQKELDGQLSILSQKFFPGERFNEVEGLVEDCKMIDAKVGENFQQLFYNFNEKFSPKMTYGNLNKILQEITKEVHQVCASNVGLRRVEKFSAAEKSAITSTLA